MKLLNDNTLLLRRVRLLQALVYLCFFGLSIQLWRLQILQGEQYHQQAERNQFRVLPIPAPRGIIRDREGRNLVINRPAFNIVLTRENLKNLDSTLGFIEQELHLDRTNVLSRLKKFENTPLFQPITIKEDVSWVDLSTIEAHAREHPELGISQEPRRLYPLRSVGSHVLGYVGEISDTQLASGEFLAARTGDLIGKSGIERVYNSALTGLDGERRVMVNSLGRVIKVLEKKDAVPGKEIHLSLDLDLQLVGEKLLQDRIGAMVAIDPNSGEILAMVSRPAFDPNSFIGRISSEDWLELNSDPSAPFMNRATQGAYSPGSIFKIIMAYAGLDVQAIHRDDWIFCNGQLEMYDRVFHCSHPGGHGFVNINLAIQNSCNVFFYQLGREMGIETIAQYARKMGLGERTMVDLPGERTGVVPDPEWKKKKFGRRWFAGETISVSIGQGALSATPLQLVRAIGTVATGGKIVRPHLRRDDPAVQTTYVSDMSASFPPENREILRDAMWRVVNSGTGHLAAVSGLDICGKTGTVQVIGKEKRAELGLPQSTGQVGPNGAVNPFDDHAWFVGFAPKSNPEIAVAVFVEHGGVGGMAAAPIAAEVFKEYFAKKGLIPRGDLNIASIQKPESPRP
jgi:penicillin-binding protein 2